MTKNKRIIVLQDATLDTVHAALLFGSETNYKQVQTFLDDFKTENKEWQYSDLIEAICAEFDAEELILDTVYI